jgi:TP901 family phage tail tape measure protein
MADSQTNININIDTSQALANLKALQSQISAFQTQMARGSATQAAAAAKLRQNLINDINAAGKFNASIQNIKTTTESFTEALEKNKLSMGQYFRYAGGATKNFGKLFKSEMSTIDKVARERVKTLQTQYIQLGRDASGAMKAIAVRPLVLDMNDLGTKTAIAAQKQQILNQLLKQGSTNLLNWGKNTQWAGRQLMVGFTVPLTMAGTAAAKMYMELEKGSIKFKRVYGDFRTTAKESEDMIKNLKILAQEYTKYGVAVADTMEMAAEAAAAGKVGADLMQQVANATRLAVLGSVEQAQALETTMSLTNAFGIAAEDLAGKIDFLNAVENQTVTSIEDLTIAIPKAAPVVKQLGGDVQDLAFFLTAMKEGGINASEGANALKSGLASLINPTGKASEFLASFGVNVKGIVEANKGDVKGLVLDFASALDTLDPLNRARAIEQMFGKFQFSRLSTLFQNVIQEGTQAQKVLELSNATTEELAILSERELKRVESSPMFKFQKAVEDIKVKLAPIGEAFLKAVTPILDFVSKFLDGFNKMSEGSKAFWVTFTGLVAGVGPLLLMSVGLVANGIANLVKMFVNIKSFINRTTQETGMLGESTTYMTETQIKAAAVAASLDQIHQQLTQRFTSEAVAVDQLTQSYVRNIDAQRAYSPAGTNPTNIAPQKFARGGMVSGPGTGTSDSVPAMLSNGEAVIPAKSVKKNRGLVENLISGKVLKLAEGGIVNKGEKQFLGMPQSFKARQRSQEDAQAVYAKFAESPRADMPVTKYKHQLSVSKGHSFPLFRVGGMYETFDGRKVFVKPVMDFQSAMAEIRGTEIARGAHGLRSPQQRLVAINDPTDKTGTRRFYALESDFDPTFSEVPQTFSKEEYTTQLVASLLRGDKDLGQGNLGGNILPDVGTAGVFAKASGFREYEPNMKSMEEQALINLLGVKGGAKKWFAESTKGIAASMSPQEYQDRMRNEIEQTLPRLKQTIAGFPDLTPEEQAVYGNMVARLEAARGVDWTKYHALHSNLKLTPPKKMAEGGIVGENVDPRKPTSIFDIDDTLLDLRSFMPGHRAANEKLPVEERLDWKTEVAKNPVGMPATIAKLHEAQARGNTIILMTARPKSADNITLETLAKLGIDTTKVRLMSRKDGDYRRPERMKYEKTARLMSDHKIEEFYDDMDKTRGAVGLLGIPAFNPLKMAMGGILEMAKGGIIGKGKVVPEQEPADVTEARGFYETALAFVAMEKAYEKLPEGKYDSPETTVARKRYEQYLFANDLMDSEITDEYYDMTPEEIQAKISAEWAQYFPGRTPPMLNPLPTAKKKKSPKKMAMGGILKMAKGGILPDRKSLGLNPMSFDNSYLEFLKQVKPLNGQDAIQLKTLNDMVQQSGGNWDSLAPGLKAAIMDKLAVHQTNNPKLSELLHPDTVPSNYRISNLGKGMYFSAVTGERDFATGKKNLWGKNEYKISMSDDALKQTIGGKGYINGWGNDGILKQKAMDWIKNGGLKSDVVEGILYDLQEGGLDPYSSGIGGKIGDPFIQSLIKEGYQGFEIGPSEYVNWNIGTNPGYGVQKYARGGMVSGPGTGTSDSIPAMLSNGEAVIPADSVSRNRGLVESLISGKVLKLSQGGILGEEPFDEESVVSEAMSKYGGNNPDLFEAKLRQEIQLIVKNTQGELQKDLLEQVKIYVQQAKTVAERSMTEFFTQNKNLGTEQRPEVNMRPSYYPPAAKQAGVPLGLHPSEIYSTDQAHVKESGTMLASELLASGTDQIKGAFKKQLEQYIKYIPNFEVIAGSGFTFAQDSQLNNKMKFDNPVPTADFAADFKRRGPEKWKQTFENAGLNWEEHLPEIELLDQEILRAVENFGELNIRSSQVADIIGKAREKLGPQIAGISPTIEQLESNIYDVRVNAREQLDAAGFPTTEDGKHSIAPDGTLLPRPASSIRESRIRNDRPRVPMANTVPPSATGAGDMGEFIDGAESVVAPQDDPFELIQDKAKRSSPHHDAFDLGAQDQQSYNQGAESVPPAEQPAKKLGLVQRAKIKVASMAAGAAGQFYGTRAFGPAGGKLAGQAASAIADKGLTMLSNGFEKLKAKVVAAGTKIMNHFENNIDKEVQSRTMIHEQRQMLAQQMLLGTDEEYLALQTQAEILQAKHQQGYQFTQQELDAAARDMQIMQEKENALIQDMEANGLESEVIKERLRLAEQRGIAIDKELLNNIQQGKGVPGGDGAGPGTKTKGAGMEKFTRNLSGYMMTASMVMGSLSMMGGEVGKVAQAITPLLGGFSMLTMLLQNMGKTMGFITLLAAAVAVAWLSMTKYNDTIASGIDKVLEFTDSIGAGAKAIQGLADFAGKVTASEIMDRRRQGQLSPFTVVSGKSTFGESFVESETGQATTKALGSASAAMGGASQQSALFAQLSTAVLSNAITTKQARSIAISIGKKMGNVNLGIKVAGELASLMGPNGEDILKNGLEIRTKIIQQSQEQISTAATNIENSGMRNGDETGMMLGGIAAGAGVGAAAGAVAGSMIAGPIGAGIGAVIGTVAGGITGYFTASEEYGKRLGKLAGANVAIQAAALNQQKQLLDSLELDYEKRIKVAEAAGNAAKAERLQNEYITARQKLLNKTAETQQQISDSFAASDYQDQLLSGAEKVVTKKYKGTAQEDLATIAIENLRSSVTDKGQRYNLLLDLGTTIDPDSMLLLTSLVKNDADVMQKAFDIRTNLTGTGLAQVLQVSRMFVDENGKSNKKMQAEFVTKMSTVKGEKAEQLLQMYSELGRMNSNWIDATVLVDFVSKRPDVEKALMEDIEEIKNLKPKMLTVDIVQRASILNEQAMDVLRDNEKYFSTIKTKAEQQIYLSYVATFSGTMNFEDPNFLAWLSSPENKDGAKADIVGWGMYTDFVARRAVNDRILVDNTVGAGNQNNNGGGPSASWLDDYVKGVRDLTDASQKLTVGYSASQKALEAFAKKGSSFKNMFSGLTNNLFAANVSQDIIDNILGMPKEEAEKEMKRFFDSSGKATKFLKQLNEISARQKIEGQFVGGLQATKSIYDRVDATKALALGNQNAALTSELMADSDMVLALSGIKLIGNLKDQKKAVHELAKAKLANLAAERLSKGTVQNEIDDAQVRIDTLEAENGVYQNGLDIISKKAEKINETYDKQIQALQEVKSVNDDIARQKQGELDIADALSRGDIGAAAKAAQQLRAQNAQAAADAQVKALEDAKKRAVDALTVEINGQKLSRADLEQKMYDIQLQVLEIRKDEIVQNEVILAKQREILNTLVAQTAEQIKKNAEASKPQTQTITRKVVNAGSGTGTGVVDDVPGSPPADPGKITTVKDAVAALKTSNRFRQGPNTSLSNLYGYTRTPDASGNTAEDLFRTANQRRNEEFGKLGLDKNIRLQDQKKWATLTADQKTNLLNLQATYDRTAEKSLSFLSKNLQQSTSKAFSLLSPAIRDSLELLKANAETYKTLKDNYTQANNSLAAREKAIGPSPMASEKAELKALSDARDVAHDAYQKYKGPNIDPLVSALAGSGIGTAELKAFGVQGFKMGGMVMPQRFLAGGFARGTDTIPAMLTPGEFVVSQPAVKSFGVDNLKSINSGTYGGDSVYNYSVNVNVANSGANANDIARTVMAQIKQIDSQRIRSNVL